MGSRQRCARSKDTGRNYWLSPCVGGSFAARRGPGSDAPRSAGPEYAPCRNRRVPLGIDELDNFILIKVLSLADILTDLPGTCSPMTLSPRTKRPERATRRRLRSAYMLVGLRRSLASLASLQRPEIRSGRESKAASERRPALVGESAGSMHNVKCSMLFPGKRFMRVSLRWLLRRSGSPRAPAPRRRPLRRPRRRGPLQRCPRAGMAVCDGAPHGLRRLGTSRVAGRQRRSWRCRRCLPSR